MMAKPKKPIEIPGKILEGGGQLVRLAIGLSSLTFQPITISQIRGGRPGGGGLKLQHLKAAEWLGKASGAQMEGAVKGSRDLEFYPHEIDTTLTDRKSLAVIDIGSPGSIALVMQAILPYVLFSGHSLIQPGKNYVEIEIRGGTNVSKSPSIEYIQHVLLPMMAKIGLRDISIDCQRQGWATGTREMGRMILRARPLAPGTALPPFQLVDRGLIKTIKAFVLAPSEARKDFEDGLTAEIGSKFEGVEIETAIKNSRHAKRYYLLLIAVSENGYRLGKDWLYDLKIRNANDVIKKMIKQVIAELKEEVDHGGCVDEYLRDQLVVYQALADGASEVNGGVQTNGSLVEPSLHTLTTYWIAKQLLDVDFDKSGNCVGMGMRAAGEDQEVSDTTDVIKNLTI
jgi:RNA 3'-terminal phosphate cyclase (ATP)